MIKLHHSRTRQLEKEGRRMRKSFNSNPQRAEKVHFNLFLCLLKSAHVLILIRPGIFFIVKVLNYA